MANTRDLSAEIQQADDLLNQGHSLEAMQAARAIIAIDPDHYQAHQIFGYAAFNANELLTATTEATWLMDNYPDEHGGYTIAAHICLIQRDFNAFTLVAQEAVNRNTNDTSLYSQLAVQYFNSHDYVLCRKAAINAIEFESDPQRLIKLYLLLAAACIELGLHSKKYLKDALQALNNLIDDAPRHIEAHYLRSKVHFASNNIEKAIQDAGVAIQLDPEHVGSYVVRAQANQMLPTPQHQLAVLDLQRAIELAGNFHHDVLKFLARSEFALNRFADAIKHYEEAHQNGMGADAEYCSNCGVAYMKLENYQEAVRFLTKAITLTPVIDKKHEELLRHRLFCHKKLKNVEELTKDEIRLFDLNPGGYSLQDICRFTVLKNDKPIENQVRVKGGLTANENGNLLDCNINMRTIAAAKELRGERMMRSRLFSQTNYSENDDRSAKKQKLSLTFKFRKV